ILYHFTRGENLPSIMAAASRATAGYAWSRHPCARHRLCASGTSSGWSQQTGRQELTRLFDRVLRGDRTETPTALTAPLPRSGTILVREWQGRAHHVTVVDDGFLWNGRTYHSLSGIARAITGTNWNGPRFFGMREMNGKTLEIRRGG